MQKVIKWRWVILALWLVVTIVLAVFQPDVNAILRQRGQDPLKENSPSKVAASILNKMSPKGGSSNIIVFHKPEKLTEQDMKQIETGIGSIKANEAELGIGDMLDPFSIPDAKSSLISEDQTTLMVSFSLDKKEREIDDIKEEFNQTLKDVKVPFYLTGEEFIQNDYLKASEKGVEKSAILTVIFILAVLIIMFRSIIIPFVSLLAVGITYLCSMGIAAQLIDKFHFPLTSLTQMLLIAILFGIGTDYNILLFNRFKEELAHGKSTDEAIIATYKTAGKTIVYSILTVFIAFAGLSFSTFGIYQSANVVAIGAVILLLEILTLTPFIMKTLGAKLFWPTKKVTGHKENKFWAKMTSTAVKYPVLTTAIIVIMMIPVLLSSGQKLSFDQLKELGDGYDSTHGFNIVAEHFSRGQALPTTVVVENNKAMDNNESLGVIDKLTDKLKEIDGVKKVASVTQPQSEPIDDFYISSQTETVADGIHDTKDGVDQIQDGIQQMQEKLVSPDFSSVDQLVSGTGQVQQGYTQITDAINQVAQGIDQGAGGAADLRDGIKRLHAGLNTVATETATLSNGMAQLNQGYKALGDGYDQLESKLPAIQQGLAGMNGLIGGLGAKYSDLSQDPDYLTLKQTGTGLESGMAQIIGGFQELNNNYTQLNDNFAKASEGLQQIAGAQTQITTGLASLSSGTDALVNGLKEGAAGNREIAMNMKKLNEGLAGVKDGQQKLSTGLSQLSDGMTQLKDGLGKSGNGLGDISDGLDKTGNFITELNSSKTFFIPREALTNEDFKSSLNNFMSKDRTISKWIVILDYDPYSPVALETIEKINDTMRSGLNGTVLAEAKFGATGPSSTTYDMNAAQVESFSSTAIIIIAGIFLVLLFVIRKFWPSVYIILSLLASYYVAMAASNIVAEYIIHADGVSSFVPFFSFIIIVAVGVDYSIFLMMRYKEHEDLPIGEAIIHAAKHVGGVVISAMIILGGTLATLAPSGLILLIELAVATIVGLIVLCFIFLPMLLPALMVLPDAIKNRKKTSNSENLVLKISNK
ncbi:MMPL family transporter [Paenibacillus segetis]|uniref:Membrane protein n=1 Tax=Paenibacillus segetis TaxID=1325360 RepID=A0ABQ1YDJ6_9BACL|nr:MMPL family transporter [Paenibacillus segetis]GGH21454.1 membrane protein [Paenibacillus segetis]